MINKQLPKVAIIAQKVKLKNFKDIIWMLGAKHSWESKNFRSKILMKFLINEKYAKV